MSTMADSTDQDTDQRLERLEQENQELRQALAALKTRSAIAPSDTEQRLTALELELNLVREVSSAIVSQLDLTKVLDLVAEKRPSQTPERPDGQGQKSLSLKLGLTELQLSRAYVYSRP